jgi:serine/threonine-protein kinase
VALKVIRAGELATAEQVRRFHQEANEAAGLDHPNIVPVYEVGEDAGLHFFTMRLIEGGGLDRHLERYRGDARGAARVVAQVARAVHHAHQRQLLHRDLKPSNILLEGRAGGVSPPVPHVADFGLAKRLRDGGEASQSAGAGTPEYMAPEQAGSERLTTAADVYGLGGILYALLAGRPPFRGDSGWEVIKQKLAGEPDPPSRHRPGCPRDLETICLKCLAREPGRRYGSAEAVAEDLERFVEGRPVRARPVGVLGRTWRWARRKPAGAALWAVGLAVVLVGGGGGLWLERAEAGRRAELGRQAEAAVAEARELMDRTPSGGSRDVTTWAQAKEAAKRARALLEQGAGNAELPERVRDLAADLDLIEHLERIRLGAFDFQKERFDFVGEDRRYAAAFRDYGIDVDGLPVTEAAARIQARHIRAALVAALDHWAYVRQKVGPDTPWRHLLNIALQAAPEDVEGNRLRLAVASRKRQAVRDLAAEEILAKLPVPTVVFLGNVLEDWGERELAADVLLHAVVEQPGDLWANITLGDCYRKMKPARWAEAASYFTAALALRADDPDLLNNLAIALGPQGRLKEAAAFFRRVIRLKPKYAWPHQNLGTVLQQQGRLQEAVASFERAVQLKPAFPLALANLGTTLLFQGELEKAVARFREAIQQQPKYIWAHNDLSVALRELGRLEESIKCCHAALKLNPRLPHPHLNLGRALQLQGKFREALVALKEGNRLEPRFSHGKEWLRACQRQVALEARLPALLAGKACPADADQQAAFGELCALTRLHGTAARLYEEAFTGRPQLGAVRGVRGSHFYTAACAAARAGCGTAEDAANLTEAQRGHWRRRALEWLRADLRHRARELEADQAGARFDDSGREHALRLLARCQADPDLQGLREAAALDRLPAAEKQACRLFWAEVAALLKRAQRP